MSPIFRIIVLVVGFSFAAPADARAQSFFETLFGLGEKTSTLPPPMPSYRAPLHVPPRATAIDSGSGTHRRGPRQVRTMCVRKCDGYYFPLSRKVSSRRLSSESNRCKAACGSEALVYYSDRDDETFDPAAMVDLTGRRYDALDTAFAYRKALLPGCTCKPPPWSSAARVRHNFYALEEALNEIKTAKVKGLPALPGTRPGKEEIEEQDDRSSKAVAAASRRLEPKPERPRRRQALEVQRARASQADTSRRQRYSRAQSSSGGLFGLGQQQNHVWPGDVR